jgi:hypothetical protein
MTKTVKFFALFVVLALAASAASSHTVTFFQPSTVSGTELKAGDYKLMMENDKVVIQKGKEKVEATVKVESADSKYASTSVRYSDQNGKMKVTEIRLGGTNTKLLFN